MSDCANPPPPPAPWPSTRLPLANLSPEIASAQPAFIEGVATLIWPFSQSAQTFSILLCEEDFRLRINRGQLRLNFKGPSAKEVATRVDIGNKVVLMLEGVEWEELGEATKRDVPWSANVRGGVRIKIQTDTGEENIDLDAPAETAEEDHEEEEEEAEEENEEKDSDNDSEHNSPLMTPSRPSDALSWASQSWKTPGIFKRPIDMLSDSPLFPTGFFGEEEDVDYEIEPAPRKKMRFSQSFRMHSRSPSPTPNVPKGENKVTEEKPILEQGEEGDEEEREHIVLQYQDAKVETSDEDTTGKLSVYKDPGVGVEPEGVEKEEEPPEYAPETSNVDVEMKDGDDDTLSHLGPQKPEDEPSETSEAVEDGESETSHVDNSTQAVASEVVGTDQESSHNDNPSQTPSQSTESAYQPMKDTDGESAQSERSPSPSSNNKPQDVKTQDEVPMSVVGTLATPPETQKAAELQEPESSVRSNEEEDKKAPQFDPGSTPPDTQPSPMDVDDDESTDEREEYKTPQPQPRIQEVTVRGFATQSSSDAPAESQNDAPMAMRDSTPNDEDIPTTEKNERAGAERSSSPQSPAESPKNAPQTGENIHPRTPSPENTPEPAAYQVSHTNLHPPSPTLKPVPSPQLPQVSPLLARFTSVDPPSLGRQAPPTSTPSTAEPQRCASVDSSASTSDKDSLFDGPSDLDPPPSLKSMIPAKPSPPPFKLSTPVRRQSDSTSGIQKTPQLYLPTPSPKVAKKEDESPCEKDQTEIPVPSELQGFFRRLSGQELPTMVTPSAGDEVVEEEK